MNNTRPYLKNPLQIIKSLQDKGIDPLLYGSTGVSIYLGEFKKFNDIDLLIPGNWLEEKWDELQSIMEGHGFRLIDLHEHEFEDQSETKVAFASEDVLLRDGVIDDLSSITSVKIYNTSVRTLSPEDFRAAYLFSEKDGYRKDKRGKKDRLIIELLDSYIASLS